MYHALLRGGNVSFSDNKIVQLQRKSNVLYLEAAETILRQFFGCGFSIYE